MSGYDIYSNLQIAASTAYLVASAGYGGHLLLRYQALARTGRWAGFIGVALQTLAIGLHCAVTRQTPFTTPFETLSAAAWGIAIIYLLTEMILRSKSLALGAFAFPVSFLCLFTGAALQQKHYPGTPHASAAVLDSTLISLHVIAILFAFSLAFLACGSALFYLAQHYMLKKKLLPRNVFTKLPPLSNLDQLGFAFISIAFPLLTLGLTAGLIGMTMGGFHGGTAFDPKVIGSLVVWIIYGIFLTLHRLAQWRGPRANVLLLGGLVMILVTLFAPTAHRFG